MTGRSAFPVDSPTTMGAFNLGQQRSRRALFLWIGLIALLLALGGLVMAGMRWPDSFAGSFLHRFL